MNFVVENLRLKELVHIVDENKPYFDELIEQLRSRGYNSLFDFINEVDDSAVKVVFQDLLERSAEVDLYDGLLRPYPKAKANWLFLCWVLRDAPVQRLQPLVSSQPGDSNIEKKALLLNVLRKHVAPLFPDKDKWEWAAISEVLLARLEGSRRALKGNLFEEFVRNQLRILFRKHSLNLIIEKREVKLEQETYDIMVRGPKGAILIPVKTRETMGGGHALLFTRDIFKSISVAEDKGYRCVPIIIAESWGGDLKTLRSKHYIYIQMNPNQLSLIKTILERDLEGLVHVFRDLI